MPSYTNWYFNVLVSYSHVSMISMLLNSLASFSITAKSDDPSWTVLLHCNMACHGNFANLFSITLSALCSYQLILTSSLVFSHKFQRSSNIITFTIMNYEKCLPLNSMFSYSLILTIRQKDWMRNIAVLNLSFKTADRVSIT